MSAWRLGLGVIVLLGSAAGASGEDAPSAASARRVVESLASDEMRGRGAGSPELEVARDLVRVWMESAGLSPVAGEWFQTFVTDDGRSVTNVTGFVPGTGEDVVVVGAHYDGLGVAPDGAEHAGEILNGADDNASGVATLLEAAKLVATAGELERGVCFVAFDGEETGALGSRHFAANPPFPRERIAAMLNLDTVGRVENGRLIVFGTGTAEEFPALLQGVNYEFGFDIAPREGGAGASDHTPFFEKGIPVLHFFSGATPDIHRSSDDPSTLDYEAIAKLAGLVAETTIALTSEDLVLTFRPSGVERLAALSSSSGSKARRRVSLGTIPDFSRESGGILLTGVLPSSAADEAGLMAGDLIVELGGSAIDTIFDYQAALAAHEPGDEVKIVYVRDGESRETRAVLRKRG